MGIDKEKLSFIENDFLLLQKNISADTVANWGKMNAQQTVEHLIDFFKVSTEKIKFDLVTLEEHLPKYREFLFSDKQFRENTKAPLNVIGEDPMPLRYSTYEEAIAKLHKAIGEFVEYFKNDPLKLTVHPVFGPLNFEEWILLHYKHCRHHLRQFDIDC